LPHGLDCAGTRLRLPIAWLVQFQVVPHLRFTALLVLTRIVRIRFAPYSSRRALLDTGSCHAVSPYRLFPARIYLALLDLVLLVLLHTCLLRLRGLRSRTPRPLDNIGLRATTFNVTRYHALFTDYLPRLHGSRYYLLGSTHFPVLVYGFFTFPQDNTRFGLTLPLVRHAACHGVRYPFPHAVFPAGLVPSHAPLLCCLSAFLFLLVGSPHRLVLHNLRYGLGLLDFAGLCTAPYYHHWTRSMRRAGRSADLVLCCLLLCLLRAYPLLPYYWFIFWVRRLRTRILVLPVPGCFATAFMPVWRAGATGSAAAAVPSCCTLPGYWFWVCAADTFTVRSPVCFAAAQLPPL